MNRPVARWRSDHWTCRSTRHPGPRARARLDRARSAFGCRRQPASPSRSPARLPARLAFDGVARHGPRPARRRRRKAGSRLRDSSTSAEEIRASSMHAQLDADACASGATDAADLPPAMPPASAAPWRSSLTATRIGRVSHAGSRRNRGRPGLRIARGRPARDQVIAQRKPRPRSSARRLVAVGLSAGERRDRLARSGRHPGARHRHQAASPCAGRMSTWIARWRAPATRSRRRSAHARPVARSCDCVRASDDLLSRLAADASVTLQPIRDASSAWRRSGPRRTGPTPA